MVLGIDPWTESTVAELFYVQLGKRLDAAVNRGDLRPCINNRGVRWGRVVVSESVMALLTKTDIRDLRLVAGDVLVCEGGEIGRASVWNDELPEAYFLNTLHRLRSKGHYEPRLLVAFFERWATTGALSALVGKSSLAHLTKENLLRVHLPVPMPAEQQRLVEVFSTVDQLVAVLERLIAKKQAIKQGMMQQLLTGKTRLPGFTSPWCEVTLGDLGNTYGGLSGKSATDFGSGNARFITFMDVMNNIRVDRSRLAGVRVAASEKQNSVAVGDVLFNGSSETAEELALASVVVSVEARTYLNSFCFGFRPSLDHAVHSQFLAYLFRGIPGRNLLQGLAQGSTRYNLSKSKFRQLSLRMPDVEEQAAIAKVLGETDDEIEAQIHRLRKVEAIRQGMKQELLTGRTRLLVGEAVS